MNYYISVLKKYAVFEGRARRAEFWYFALFNIIVGFIINIISGLFGDKYGIMGIIYQIGVIVPSIAVAARRLHDINKSGWWQLIGLIPLIGWIWYLVLVCTDSDVGDNRFGPNPKGSIATVVPPVTPTQN